jgi:hypothetical protein
LVSYKNLNALTRVMFEKTARQPPMSVSA